MFHQYLIKQTKIIKVRDRAKIGHHTKQSEYLSCFIRHQLKESFIHSSQTCKHAQGIKLLPIILTKIDLICLHFEKNFV